MLSSCVNETDETWDPYYNWEMRNAEWYNQIADSARTDIAKAKAAHGDAWEEYSDWRMYRSLMRSDVAGGPLTDSICVHIRQRGTGTVSPLFTDTASVCFRGWTMLTEYEQPGGELKPFMAVFTQTFTGQYNPTTAQPQLMPVASTVEGFNTALQYMVEGDIWDVYIPQQLAYGAKASDAIPAFSTLLFRLYMREK